MARLEPPRRHATRARVAGCDSAVSRLSHGTLLPALGCRQGIAGRVGGRLGVSPSSRTYDTQDQGRVQIEDMVDASLKLWCALNVPAIFKKYQNMFLSLFR